MRWSGLKERVSNGIQCVVLDWVPDWGKQADDTYCDHLQNLNVQCGLNNIIVPVLIS